MAPAPSRILRAPKWTDQAIRQEVFKVFKVYPCKWQMDIARALYEGLDVVSVAATGAGKTLSFWIALLMARAEGKTNAQIIVVAPLNVLGKQNEKLLNDAGIRCIAVQKGTATKQVFDDIERGIYNVVVISPELLMKDGGRMKEMLRKSGFYSRLQYVVIDEAHCLVTWSDFRPDYSLLNQLRYLIPDRKPLYAASATLLPHARQELARALQLRDHQTVNFLYSNDRPNLRFSVRFMKHAANSFLDLSFLTRTVPELGRPETFAAFFESMEDAQEAAISLRALLPPEHKDKIVWFHAKMSNEYRQEQIEKLKRGELWGICTTEAFGLGVDVSGIIIVVQYGVKRVDVPTLAQRLGRAGRRRGEYAHAIVIAEKEFSDEERDAAAKKRRERQEKAADKAAGKIAAKAATRASHATDRIREGPASTLPAMGATSAADRLRALQLAREQDEARRLKYHAATAKQVSTPKPQTVAELEPALDDFVNAKFRNLCRRRVLDLAFGNDLCTSDFRDCPSWTEEASCRCAPVAVTVCCDVCNPDAIVFQSIAPMELPVRPRTTRKTGVKKTSYDRNAPEVHKLRKELDAYRLRVVDELFPDYMVQSCGESLFLPTDVLERIVDVAFVGKLASLEALERELSWSTHVKTHGAEILRIVNSVHPQPVEVSKDTEAGDDGLAAQAGSSVRRCGSCRQPGHRRDSPMCPKYTEYVEEKAAKANPTASSGIAQPASPRRPLISLPASVLNTPSRGEIRSASTTPSSLCTPRRRTARSGSTTPRRVRSSRSRTQPPSTPSSQPPRGATPSPSSSLRRRLRLQRRYARVRFEEQRLQPGSGATAMDVDPSAPQPSLRQNLFATYMLSTPTHPPAN